jgi:hypothetical protein
MLHEKFSVLLLFLSGRVGLCGFSCTCVGFQLDFKTFDAANCIDRLVGLRELS